MLADNPAALKLFRHMGDARKSAAGQGVVELVMDLPDEGIPEALRHAVRAVAGGEVKHEMAIRENKELDG